jgi:3-isopropylmalate dehydratase small subunit
MERFTRLSALAAPMPQADIDTDIIFPARFLVHTQKRGLGRFAFYEWRYGPDGAPIADFVLNQARFQGARILVCGENFGCGSSREQAPWALRDLGLRCLISTRFGEIFYANCFKNGLLPVVVGAADHAALMADAAQAGALDVDLAAQTILRPDGQVVTFSVEPFLREALLEGWDEISIVLRQDGARITEFEQRQRAARPWLYERD